MKRCSTFLITREMKVKTTMSYHLTAVRMVTIKKSTNNKCWRGCGEMETLLHCWWRHKLIQPIWGTVVGRGCLLWPVYSLRKTLLAFALLHFVLQSQTFLLFQLSLYLIVLHSSPSWWQGHLFKNCLFHDFFVVGNFKLLCLPFKVSSLWSSKFCCRMCLWVL